MIELEKETARIWLVRCMARLRNISVESCEGTCLGHKYRIRPEWQFINNQYHWIVGGRSSNIQLASQTPGQILLKLEKH